MSRRALQKLGNTVELCTYHIGRDMPDIPTHRIPHVGWYTKTDAGPAWGKLYLMCLLFLLSWRELRRFKPDILHGHGWDGCWIAWALHLLTGVPFIFNMQGKFQRRDRSARLCQAEQPVFQTAPVDRTLDTAPGTCGQPVTEHDRGGDPGLRRAARLHPPHL
jgi:hypothetical protein